MDPYIHDNVTWGCVQRRKFLEQLNVSRILEENNYVLHS